MDEITALNTEKATIMAKLQELAGVVDVSEGGRSFNVSGTVDRLQRRLDWINQRLVQLQPFTVISTHRV